MASFLTAAVATKPLLSFTTDLHSPSVSTKPTTSLCLRRNSFKVNAIATKYEPSKVKPQADRVLIRLEELPQQSAGGVLLPKSAVKFERYLMGEILAVVLVSDVNAYEVDLGAEGRHCFCKASDLLAVVE
ncbi:10 kDa chaperonin 1, chloroplastic-like [Bidens hawaiensis]|uniref:10 kDa chaperonin 1, chloroplastic-like n=1 Tax=Bidens hawaiensis TaxID=980011 RepID=UPI00404AA9DD